jgi:hypothetical protein
LLISKAEFHILLLPAVMFEFIETNSLLYPHTPFPGEETMTATASADRPHFDFFRLASEPKRTP